MQASMQVPGTLRRSAVAYGTVRTFSSSGKAVRQVVVQRQVREC
jgi:hypothetical protein